MDFRNETQIIHSCYAAGWEKYQCHLPGNEEHLLIYQGRQLCDEKQAPSVLVNVKLIVRCFYKFFVKCFHFVGREKNSGLKLLLMDTCMNACF